MIQIKRYPSGQFLEYMARDIWKRQGRDLEPENMLDGTLGYRGQRDADRNLNLFVPSGKIKIDLTGDVPSHAIAKDYLYTETSLLYQQISLSAKFHVMSRFLATWLT